MDARSKIDVIYQDGLADLRAVLELAAEVQKSLITASEDLKHSGDVMVEVKLQEFREAITTVAETTINNALEEALGRHVTGEIIKLKGEINKITSQLHIAIGQTKQSQIVVAGLSGLAGALLATFIGLGAISSGIVTVPDSATAAAVAQTASNVKQVTKPR